MSGFELRDLDDGTVELVESIPTVIATFADRSHAERYFAILAGVDKAAAVAKVKTPRKDPARPAAASAPKAAQAMPAAPAQSAPAPKPDADVSDEGWETAFRALAAGGDLREISATLGVNAYKLRGKYGAWCRRRTNPVASEQPAAASDTEECRLCGKEFQPGASVDGLCARCSRG